VQAPTDEDKNDAAALLSQAYSGSARSYKELWDQSSIGSVARQLLSYRFPARAELWTSGRVW
jgi:hypothetical protein